MPRVENMENPITGRKIPNQFVIADDHANVTTFQSYDSPIVTIDAAEHIIYVYPEWECSTTTGKYRNQFMREMGFNEMADKDGFKKCLNSGYVYGYKVMKTLGY